MRRAMNPMPQSGRMAALLLTALLSACGGGGGGDTVSSTTSGSSAGTTAASLTEGTIAGFGSVIVGGVRFDDSAAKVSDDDGGTKSRDDLKLGMTVSIDSSSVSNSSATASSIEVHSEIAGPVESVNLLGNSLVVLGQKVTVDASTVYDESLSGGLSAITTGLVVEIYARYDAASASYAATRIDKRGNSSEYKLRGVLSALNTGTKRFNINGALIDYSAAKEVPASLANGQYVKVKLLTTQLAGAWSATKVQNGRSTEDNHSEAEVKGSITAFTSATQFSVNGLPVDASKASFPKGTSGIVLGAFVEVAGAVTNGVLIATKVAPEDDLNGDGDDDSKGGDDDGLGVELKGTLSSLDTSAKTFIVRGVKTNYASATFSNGTSANLANGASVEVKGTVSSDGSTVTAASVKFDK